jgi:hypothetical protein
MTALVIMRVSVVPSVRTVGVVEVTLAAHNIRELFVLNIEGLGRNQS